jgi:hypothetical protein
LPAVEESFLHLWDELDDIVHACRHVAATAVAEVAAAAAPVLAAASGSLLGGATLLLAHRHLLNPIS